MECLSELASVSQMEGWVFSLQVCVSVSAHKCLYSYFAHVCVNNIFYLCGLIVGYSKGSGAVNRVMSSVNFNKGGLD